MAATTENEELAGVGSKAKGGRARRGTRAEALDIIFATAEDQGEGFRHGVLGTPRYGKTYHLKEVAQQARERGICELLLLHDCKRREVQYDNVGGIVRANKADLQLHPLTPEDDAVVVFHGNPDLNVKCSVDEVADLGLSQGRAGTSTLVLVDELYHGMKARQTWAGPAFPEILREGSSQRVSSAWTTQIPQALPTEALDCTETIAVFMLKGRSLRYAVKNLELPPEAEAVIRGLQKGEFILVTSTDDWDGVVYGPN